MSGLFEDERGFINHLAMFGAHSVVQKCGRKWSVGYATCQHPSLFDTKREAGEAASKMACAMGLRHQQELVKDAERFIEKGQVDAALDLIYSTVDRMLKAQKLSEVDAILTATPFRSTSLEILISLLTVTLPVRIKLPSRPKFFRAVEEVAREDSRWSSSQLVGLE